jgi:hypothetical protein
MLSAAFAGVSQVATTSIAADTAGSRRMVISLGDILGWQQ